MNVMVNGFIRVPDIFSVEYVKLVICHPKFQFDKVNSTHVKADGFVY